MTTMETVDFEHRYRTKTNEELMELALDTDDLSLEARDALKSALSKRQIEKKDIDEYRDQKKERRESDKDSNRKTAHFLWPSLGKIRATLNDWKKYKHQTGEWPILTIGFSFLHLLIDLAGLVFILWYSGKHHWSKGTFLLVILPLILVDVLVSDRFVGKIRLFEISRYRHRDEIGHS
jgi:hypothetical protein